MAGTMRLPWWEADDTVQKFQRKIADAQEQLRRLAGAARVEVEARAFVSTVMVSCEAERMPALALKPREAFQILTTLYYEILHLCTADTIHFDRRFFYLCEHNWPWQGYAITGSLQGVRAACLSQMKQHLKALMFLCIYNKDRSLKAPLLKSTHAILMKGCLYQDSSIQNGCFRDFPMAIEGAVVIHETAIASSINDMLCRLEGDDQSDRSYNLFHFPERCATLVHDMTHIKPFPAGNDWMCRLIMAFFMVKHDRFVFPVPIAPLTTRTSQEFLHALVTPDDDRLKLHEEVAAGFRREKVLLATYILECVWDSLEEVMSSH